MIKRSINTLMLAGILLLTTPALAQKGTGDDTGVARQGIQADIVPLSGVVLEIDVGPCEIRRDARRSGPTSFSGATTTGR